MRLGPARSRVRLMRSHWYGDGRAIEAALGRLGRYEGERVVTGPACAVVAYAREGGRDGYQNRSWRKRWLA
jgi:hypothetical protein